MRQFNDSRLFVCDLRALRGQYGSTSRWIGDIFLHGASRLCVVLWVSIWFLYNTFIIWVHIVQRRTLLVPVLAARVRVTRHTLMCLNKLNTGQEWNHLNGNERHERASSWHEECAIHGHGNCSVARARTLSPLHTQISQSPIANDRSVHQREDEKIPSTTKTASSSFGP